MDPKLAELYGTNTVDENDIEKLAAAQLAEELGEGAELDINDLSPEDIEAMASEVLASEGGGETVEEPAGDDAQEKLAEADYLGRVMAHSYVQELRDIEKTAGKGTFVQKAGRLAERVGEKLTPKKVSDKVFSHSKRKSMEAGRENGASIQDLFKNRQAHVVKGHESVSKLHKGVGAGAAAVGAGGAAFGAKKALEKKSSALDTLAERRALEILEANGIDPASLTQAEPEQVKTSAPEALDQAVSQRAAEILAQFGLTVEE